MPWAKEPTLQVIHDLYRQDGAPVAFEIDELRRQSLLTGLDDIGLTLDHADDIDSYESTRPTWLP